MYEATEAKKDPRVQKTRRSMSTAMFLLLETSSFDKITVNDICSTAMVSRTTFYQHFRDKYELVKYALEQEGRRRASEAGDDLHMAIYGLLDYIMHNQRAFEGLFLGGMNEELMHMLADASIARLKGQLEARADAPGGVPAEVAAVFLSGGMAAIMLWWVRSNFSLSPEALTQHLLGMLAYEDRPMP